MFTGPQSTPILVFHDEDNRQVMVTWIHDQQTHHSHYVEATITVVGSLVDKIPSEYTTKKTKCVNIHKLCASCTHTYIFTLLIHTIYKHPHT